MEENDATPRCPSCGRSMTCTAMVLSRRQDDGKRVCRGVWQCGNRHLWWKWSDRPGDELETCPYPQFGG